MTTDFLIATFFNLGVNIVQTLVALVVAVLGLQFIDRKLLNRFVFRPIGYFAKGMADAVLANANAENTTADESTGLTTIVNEKLDTREQVRVGLGMATSEMLKDLDEVIADLKAKA